MSTVRVPPEVAPLTVAVSTVDKSANQAAYWSFESDTVSGGTVTDQSTNGNDGSLVGDPTVASDSVVGEGLALDGDGDVMQVAHDSSLQVQTSDFTLVAWVNTDSTTNQQGVISKKTDDGVGDDQLAYQITIGGYGGAGGSGTKRDPTFAYANGSSVVASSAGQQLSTNQWYHLAVTFEHSTSTVEWYIDGSEVNTEQLSGTPITNSQELFLGNHYDSSGSSSYIFSGTLDEVRIYDDKKSASFISELYNAGSGRLGIASLLSGSVTVAQGETATFSADLENQGSVKDTGTAELVVDGTTEDTKSVTLAAGETKTVPFDYDTSGLSASSTYTYSISFGGDQQSDSLTVNDPGSTYFDVTNLSPGKTTTQKGNTVSVTADVENLGDSTSTETVELRANSNVQDSTSLQLNPDQTKSVSFSLDTSSLSPGSYTYGVYSPSDSRTAELYVTDTELSAYWSFDSGSVSGTTVSDLSPNSNAGDIKGGAGLSSGADAEALDLDGTDDWVRVPHDSSLQIQDGDFTLAGWIRTRSTTNKQGLFSKKANATGDTALGYQLNLGGYARYGGSSKQLAPRYFGWQMLNDSWPVQE